MLSENPLTESRWLIISNLPKTATEETIKECFQRHGHVQSIKINDQHFALISFSDIRTATKAHHAENVLEEQKLRTVYYNSSKTYSSSSEECTRHQVVPINHDSLSINNTKTTTMKSSSESDGIKTRILKIYHFQTKMSNQLLHETLRNIFTDFQKSSHLLTIKIIDDYALLSFKDSEDVNKALLFIITKSINGIRLKAEPFYSENHIDEYSIKATRTLYVGNLQSEISCNELRDTYSEYGEIVEIEIKRHQQQTFAFIQYTDIKSVVKAMKGLESKSIRDHSIKLKFGKNQPTNILWLDNLPSNTTESNLRIFLNNLTNISSNEILEIYFDDRNSAETQIIQCIIYFIDINAAQNMMNSIRGKIFQSKRIQVDFASKVFITRFLDSNNRSESCCSGVSDTGSSLTLSNIIHNSSLTNSKKLTKSDKDEDANTERIFDWLRNNHHSTDGKRKKSKKVFPTKDIPHISDSSFIQTDIRLNVYSALYTRSINSIRLPLPQFAKSLNKASNILNPKAYLKHFSIKNNEQSLIQKELDETISLLVPNMDEIERDSTQLIQTPQNNACQTLTLDSTLTTAVKQNSMPSSATLHSSNTLPRILLERLGPSAKIKHKTIPSSSTLPLPSDVNNSPKPTVLKSILKKQPSTPSQLTPNETRKTVQIVLTKSPVESTEGKKKPMNQPNNNIITKNMNKSPNQSVPTINKKLPKKSNSKLIKATIKSSKIVKRPFHSCLGTKVPQLPTQPKKPSLINNQTHTKPLTTIKKPSVATPAIQKLVTNNKILKKSTNKILKKKPKLKQSISMYDQIKKRSNIDQIQNNSLSKKSDVHTQSTNILRLKRHSLTIDTSESEDDISTKIEEQKANVSDHNKNKINEQESKLNSLSQKRSSIDESNESSKKIKLQTKTVSSIEPEICLVENTISANHQFISMDNKEESMSPLPVLQIDETIQFDDSIDTEQIKSVPSLSIEDPSNEEVIIIFESSIPPSIHETSGKAISTDKSIPMTLPSSFSTLTVDESISPFDPPPITNHTQILTSDSTPFTPYHQHFPYPLFAPVLPDSPPLSASSCGSIIGNPFYNLMSNQQHCHNQESRRSSIPSLPFRHPSELYNYPPNMLNSFPTDFYHTNNFQSCDPYNIHWEGYLVLKTDQAYIKTELIAGNPQIALISIKYWNSNIHHDLRISQRMHLDENQLNAVQKRMLMSNDHCILIAQPNGLTPDEIHLEENHLKNNFIQYFISKQAAGIINILLPGVIQPVYVVHIFPPCKFASEILQKRAPDAYRCVVKNKIDQIYLLFIITSTIQ